MCNNCCNHTHHAIIFLLILSLLLLFHDQNLTLLNHQSTSSSRSSHNNQAGDGDAGFSSPPCTAATTNMIMAFLCGALFTLILMIISNNSGSSSPKNYDNDHQSMRGAYLGAGPSHMAFIDDDDEVIEGGGVGVGFALLRTFPTFAYSVRRPPKMGKGSPFCVICQCNFRDGELVRWLPECDHLFHLSCIDKWLTSHKTCPSCRDDLDIIATRGSISNGTTAPSDIYDYIFQ